MDPQYRKFMCDPPPNKAPEDKKSSETESKPCETISENEGKTG